MFLEETNNPRSLQSVALGGLSEETREEGSLSDGKDRIDGGKDQTVLERIQRYAYASR